MNGGISPPPLSEMPQPKRNRTAWIIGISVGVFVLGTLAVGLCAGLLLPSMAAARNSARMMRSQANMAAIGEALRAYALDNGGQVPEGGADIPQRLTNYASLTGDVWDPARPAGIAQMYYYVPVGVIGEVKNPSMQPLLYEAPGLWNREGGSVLYADGSVRRVDGLAYRTFIDTIKLPDGTPWTPHKAK